MQQLEARVHISRASIYRRVGGKDEILALLRDERGVSVDKVDVQSKILEAARRMFARQGLSGTTMEQIASEAEVGIATVYRHFSNKETLIKAFIEQIRPRSTVYALTLNPSADVTADLQAIVESLLRVTHENSDMLRLVLGGNEQDRLYLSQLRENSDSTMGWLSAYFERQIEAGRIQSLGTGEELALALMGMVINFSVLAPLHHGRKIDDAETTGELIVNILLNSLRGQQS
ncbi:MAG: TetR/AcrR family transcriptional regulator [Chloroflexi bacterium]|nr:TetR/AcrR family transcriptional regulator [Chloroflexota bacterium]